MNFFGAAFADPEIIKAYTVTNKILQPGRERIIVTLAQPRRYHILVVSPQRHPGVRAREARLFAEFLLSGEARTAISKFGIDRFGQALFLPDATPP